MRTLSIDIETFSSADLSKCGVYKYAEAPDFEILLFGYSADGAPVQVVDLATGETIPDEVVAALTDDTVIKWAFNAQFERICLSRWLRDHKANYLLYQLRWHPQIQKYSSVLYIFHFSVFQVPNFHFRL